MSGSSTADGVNKSFRKRPYESQRIAVLLRKAKIHDEDLRDHYHAFVVSCYLPILANREANGIQAPNRYYNPFALAADGSISYVEYKPYRAFDTNGDPVTPADMPGLKREHEKVHFQSGVGLLDSAVNATINSTGAAATGILRGLLDGAAWKGTPGARAVPCDEYGRRIHGRLQQEVRTDGNYRGLTGVIEEYLASSGRSDMPSRIQELILEYVLYNETMGLLSMNEMKRLQEAIPEYGVFKTSQQTENTGRWKNPFSGNLGDAVSYVNPVDWFHRAKDAVSFLVKGKQSVDQWIQHRAEGPALYFKVTSYAPYVYGMSIMILPAIFPFAAFASLLPGKWTAILTWAKYFLWIKLWMVLWAILARFNEWRDLEDLKEVPSMGDTELIFAAMYLIVPGLSLIVVQLLSAAAGGIGKGIGNIAPAGGSSHINVWPAVQKAGGVMTRSIPSGGAGAAAGGGGGGPPVAAA